MFYVGQKVVCVDAANTPGKRWVDDEAPVEGRIYTVLGKHEGRKGLFLRFIEIERCAGVQRLATASGRSFVGYEASRFRPVCDRPTDISVFEALLNPVEQVSA